MTSQLKTTQRRPLEEGDRVRLIGSLKITGLLQRITPEKWAVVAWDNPDKAPRFCHLHSLVKAA